MGKPPRHANDSDDFRLPDDYDPRYIPTPKNLQNAAVDALHREVSFVLVNAKDDPQAIVERLDDLYEIIQAAGQVNGAHLPKTIRLALTLRWYFSLSAEKRNVWIKLIVPLLGKAMELGDHELESEIYRSWSVHLFAQQNQSGARQALLAALEVAENTGHADLRLLVNTERFHHEIAGLSLDEARVQARALKAEAWRLHYPYILARVNLSMAWKCRELLLREDAFNYAQQGFIVGVKLDDPVLIGECIDGMLTSLNNGQSVASSYLRLLQERLAYETQRSGSALFQGAMNYNLALQLYRQGDYEQARDLVLKAWVAYRCDLKMSGAVRVKHMLGLIQTKRGGYFMADRHLRAAERYYERVEDHLYAVHARHAHAHIALEQGQYDGALEELQTALAMAQSIQEVPVRDAIVKNIEESMDQARHGVSGH